MKLDCQLRKGVDLGIFKSVEVVVAVVLMQIAEIDKLRHF